MTEPVRVLWLIKGLGPGGAERLLVDMARHVDRERFDYRCAYMLPWKDHLVAELKDEGVPVSCLEMKNAADPRWIFRLRSYVRSGKVDVVHAHLPSAAIGARLGLRRGPAVVTTEHNTWQRYKLVTRRLNAWTFGMQDAAIAVSAGVARSIGPRTRPDVIVIPNGVDFDRLRSTAISREEARAALGLEGDGLVIGTVGGLTAKKGHEVLIRAAREVLDRFPQARFVFVGLPIAEADIRRAIVEAGLGDAVVLAGYHERASRIMRAFDVYCLPSLFEGMPVSLLEAMAMELPAVATRVGGVPEVATDGRDALLVPPSDPSALAAALIRLLSDAQLRREIGERAGIEVQRFSLAQMVRRTEAVYLEALASRKARR